MTAVGIGHAFGAVAREERLAPYRTLALRVISLAVHDLIAPRALASERDTARAFLAGSSMLTHWCKLADIDPETIQKQMQGVIDGSRTGHSHRRY